MTAHSQNAARWLALFLPRLPTDRLKRAGLVDAEKPFALYAKIRNAFELTAVDVHATKRGLHTGMPLADARAIMPALAVFEAELDEDARTLDAIAAWCERYTPVVVLDPPHGLFLDITGCAHLFGDEAALREDMIGRLAAQGFTARAAIAPTPGAAWALAHYARETIISEEQAILKTLTPLPLEALRLESEAASLLKRLGLKTIGPFAAAPHLSLTARAGEAALRRLDQALGRAPEALTPRRPAPPLFALRRFLEPLFNVETILEATKTLCGDVLIKLERRGAGARRLRLHLFGVDGRDRVIEIGVSYPERDAKALLRLFREKLNIAAENLNAEFGIEAARLDVVQLERIEPGDRALVALEEAGASAEKIAAMVDVLSARLGPQNVLRAKFNDTHAPERAGAWCAALTCEAPVLSRTPPADGVMRRPLTLFSRAQPIEAMATVPDGPPTRFRWRRVLREVTRAEGPERIAGDWLRDEPTRDYYRVEDKEGRRYWLYREGLYGETQAPRWFMHGLFA